MKTISFITQKGGAGKSNLVISLGSHIAKNCDKNVLLIDLDPQNTTTSWYSKREEDENSNLHLLEVDIKKLPLAIKKAEESGFDYVLIDTQGRDSIGIKHPIDVSDFVVIPARPTVADLEGSVETAERLKQEGKAFAYVTSQTQPSQFLFTPTARTKGAIQSLAQVGEVSPYGISSRVTYQDAQLVGQGVCEFEPKGKASREIANLWKWLEKKLNIDLIL